MGIGKILLNAPWKDILKQAPLIVEAARRLYESSKKEPNPDTKLPTTAHGSQTIAELQAEVERLLVNEEKQAKLVSNMANQVRALTDALDIVSFRLNIFIGISVVTGVISIILFIKIFFIH